MVQDMEQTVHGAVLEERMNTLITDVRELKESSRQLVALLVDQTKMQGDIQSAARELTVVNALAQQNQKDIEAIGRHVAVVSMWGKVAFTLMTVAISFMGWGVYTAVGAIRSFDKIDNRVTSLETIVQSRALENTFDAPITPDVQAPAIQPSTPPGKRR